MTERKQPTNYALGLDVGKNIDFSVLVVAKIDDAAPLRQFVIKGLMRWPLGTPYTDVASKTAEICRKLVDDGDEIESFTMDATGVGNSVQELLQRAMDQQGLKNLYVFPFVFTAKTKNDLIVNLQVLFQEGRLRIAAAELDPNYTRVLKESVEEFVNYEVRVEDENDPKLGVFKTGKHDDIVTAFALACKNSVKIGRPGLVICDF